MEKVEKLVGKFDEVYAATCRVFSSLPQMDEVDLITKALDGDIMPLLYWEAKMKERYIFSNMYNDYASVDYYPGENKIHFITPTSGRDIYIYRENDKVMVEISFGDDGSYIAAHEVMRRIKRRHPDTTAKYRMGYWLSVMDLDYTNYDKAQQIVYPQQDGIIVDGAEIHNDQIVYQGVSYPRPYGTTYDANGYSSYEEIEFIDPVIYIRTLDGTTLLKWSADGWAVIDLSKNDKTSA